MKIYKSFIFVVISLVLLIVLTSCGGQEKGAKGYIQIKGSDTEVNLVQHLAEEYMKVNKSNISVTGGGSGTGISALINGQVDIANASRAMKDSEIKQAKDNGIEPIRVIIAMDGLSVITNKSNPVSELTVEEISKIFRGEISNWNQVGGPDKAISLYGRQSNSGTFVYFRDNVIKGDYSADMKRMNGNAQIVESIKNDQAGIGYVGVGYVVEEDGNQLEGINILNVAKGEHSEAVSPLKPENVANGSYPLARPLNQYVNSQPTGKLLDFIKYEISKKGQEIAVEEGFYPVSPEFKKINENNLDL